MNRKFYSFTKRLAAVMVAAAVSVGCNVDDTYDLSSVNTDGIGLGTDDTSFDIPLVDVTVDASEAISTSVVVRTKADGEETESDSDFFAALTEINSILPSGEKIDLALVDSDDDYAAGVSAKLLAEIQSNKGKCEDFYDTIKEGEEYSDLRTQLEDDLDIDFSDDDASAFHTEIEKNTADNLSGSLTSLTTTMQDRVRENTCETIEVGSVDIGTDVIDMLNKNIDGDKNTIRIMATYDSDLTFSDGTALDMSFKGTLIYANDGEIELPDYVSEDEEKKGTTTGTVSSADILDQILANLTVELDYGIKNYNTSKTIETKDKKIKITLIVRKSGSLIL